VWQDPEATFEWNGERLSIPPRTVLPRPVQLPHPPLFLACTKRDTVTLAAEYGIGALVLGFNGPDDIAELHEIYEKGIAERTGDRFVSSVVNDHLAALCPTVVLDDATDALKVGVRGQRFFAESISHWYGGGPPPNVETAHDDNQAEIERSRDTLVAYLHEMRIPEGPSTTAIYNTGHAYGDAHTAIEYVERLVEAGADEIMCLIQMGTVPHDACMETIRHWGEQVIPHFRAAVG
jgi:alkanesulfonate monooxygenase SsuD/methylene tetrahydromethanopterin reductase-like flavin-dependent oxidoreductase (luciferase family)